MQINLYTTPVSHMVFHGASFRSTPLHRFYLRNFAGRTCKPSTVFPKKVSVKNNNSF